MMRMIMKNKPVKLPAQLRLNDTFKIDGTLSVLDGMFTFQNPKESVFAKDGTIEFEYDSQKYSFSFKNLGGKYFISNHKEDIHYQKLVTLINLAENLATKDIKPTAARRKI